MKTVSQIDTTGVSGEQIGRCHKVISSDGNFYMVESERDLFDANNERVEYRVMWTRGKGFTCTCPAGQDGFSHCGAAGVCKHVVWSVACEREVQQALRDLSARIDQERAQAAERATLVIDGRPATQEEWNRVMNAKPAPSDRRAVPALASRPFSILR